MAELGRQLEEDRSSMAASEVGAINMQKTADNHDKLAIVDKTMDESLSDPDETDLVMTRLSSEEVSSLLEPAISRTATRYKSAKTPAAEKSMILEEGSDYFANGHDQLDASSPEESTTPVVQRYTSVEPASSGLTLGKLPTAKPDSPGFPISPWKPGPRKLQIQETTQPPSRSILQGVFSNRTRSLSGGAEALRKLLPKGLPSMSQVGSIFSPSSSSPPKSSFGSQTHSVSRDQSTRLRKQERSTAIGDSQYSSGQSTPRFESIISEEKPLDLSENVSPNDSTLHPHGSGLRRVNSDDVLYHSLSRASSLGDDTRFEGQTEMVNSRSKAIRDSWQDRSSFRLPQISSIPSMPRMADFSFTKTFINSSNSSSKSATSTDWTTGILASSVQKKVFHETSGPAVVASSGISPGLVNEGSHSAVTGSNTEIFEEVLKHLTGDVVIMGGYRGSILRSAKTHRQLWVPVKVGLNIRKVDLEVGLNPEDEERMEETIYSSGMLQNIGPVDISRRLFKRLRDSENARNGTLRIWDYGYDWRLSPSLLSRKLAQFLKTLPSNGPAGEGALVIAHSLGGLITRHVVNHYPELFSGVVYAGVPHACVNILGPLRNGDAVLLSSRVLTAQVNFTLRTSFVLLPEDGGCFIDINTKERYPIDFFNVEDWIKYRLSPCTDLPLPPRNSPAQPPGPFESLLSRTSNFQNKRKSFSFSSNSNIHDSTNNSNTNLSPSSPNLKASRATDVLQNMAPHQDKTLGMQMDNNKSQSTNSATGSQSISTTVTIPRHTAIAYLTRVLAETKTFKQELHFNPALEEANRYPPAAIIYGKSIPTVFGAKVDGREGIPCSDSYDNLAFASGDGVCLAKEAMLPEGYRCVGGGRISSDRGHVTLLGDLNAVGRAIEAVKRGRAKGIGNGLREKS